MNKNPLLSPPATPFGVPPFDKIEAQQFVPAIEEAIVIARSEADAITANDDPPTFSNSIETLEKSGKLLGDISATLFNLNSAETTPELQKAAMEAAPLLTKFSNDITLNDELFDRIQQVYKGRKYTIYTPEQTMLLEQTYKGFVRGGAGLPQEKRKQFREISSELSSLTLKFEENVLAETNSYILHLTDSSDLEGLPPDVVKAAAAEAESKELKGWLFTLHAPSYIPFMQYSAKRGLREKIYRAYSSRAFSGNEHDNREIVIRITILRYELAKLLGYDDFASYVLEERMAESPDNVWQFLRRLLSASMPAAVSDHKTVSEYAVSKGHRGDLMRWDWAYYSEMLKKEQLSLDDEILKPYFRLERAEEAILRLAGTLFGIEFQETDRLPLYHPSVKTFEVTEKGEHLAILYLDYFPRPGKSGGAWMTTYRDQHICGEKDVRPVVSLVMNFPPASGDTPSLLTHNDLKTYLHEFGHALHAILSRCTYESLSGTSVMRDFVELPSQLMENWSYEREWLDTWAEHYQSGEKIPAEILGRLKELAIFNEGYACLRQISFGMLDMAWHTLKNNTPANVDTFEKNAMMTTELFPPAEGTNMSTAFSHLFAGGYAAGYYGYKWAEVLEADAWELFTEKGIFDQETASSLRSNILERGNTDKPGSLYREFRGREPSIEPLLRKSGFNKK